MKSNVAQRFGHRLAFTSKKSQDIAKRIGLSRIAIVPVFADRDQNAFDNGQLCLPYPYRKNSQESSVSARTISRFGPSLNGGILLM